MRLWFQAMWYVTNQKHGVSALGLQRILGRSYQTAWAWLHKLRRAMVRRGVISWAARSRWTKPMWAAGKPASSDEDQVDRRDCGGSPRAGHWPDPNEPRRGCGCEEPIPFANNRGAWRDRPNRWLVSLQWSGAYDHQPRSISASGDPAMPRVHRVAALLDRWWLGIHHGAIDADHLDYYLDEFTFRFNRRRSQARGLRLLQRRCSTSRSPTRA